MRWIFFFILILMSEIGICQDNFDTELIPITLKNRANACIRNEEKLVDMQSPEQVIVNVKKAITVFNHNGENEASLVIFYDKNTSIKSIKGEIYNASGIIINKFNQNNFIDASAVDGFSLFIDSRIKHFTPAVNQYPYTVVYNYEIKYKQNLIIRDWKPKPSNNVSVEKSSYTFQCKPTDQIRIKAQNFSDQPIETLTDKQKKYTWNVTNLPAIKNEPYSPDEELYQIRIKIAPQQFSYFGYKGYYSNWQELGKWAYNDLLKDRRALPPATIQTIKDLVKNDNEDKEKVRKIYQYLQEKTRYVSVQIGIGGFQPIAASEVDRLGYGDCKALVNYMQSLLEAVNIQSNYCVVEAGNVKKSLDPNFADMVQGNHIILCVPLKGDTTWLECTSQTLPFGFLSDFTDDRLVLSCTSEGGKLLKTPKFPIVQNLQQRKANLTISPSGNIIGTINTIYMGAQYNNPENIIDKSITEQQKLLKAFYDIDNINFSTIKYNQDKGITPKTTEDLTLDIRNYAVINGQKMFLQINAFNIKKSVPELKSRVLPLYLNRGYTDEDEIVYNLPDNVLLDGILPQSKTMENEFGSYTFKTVVEGRKFIYYRKFVMNEGTFNANRYADFAKFINQVNAYDYLKIAFNLK